MGHGAQCKRQRELGWAMDGSGASLSQVRNHKGQTTAAGGGMGHVWRAVKTTAGVGSMGHGHGSGASLSHVRGASLSHVSRSALIAMDIQ